MHSKFHHDQMIGSWSKIGGTKMIEERGGGGEREKTEPSRKAIFGHFQISVTFFLR